MTTYTSGHVKRDPVTGAAAIRTIFDDAESVFNSQAWLIATTDRGAIFGRTSDVESWEDVYTPPDVGESAG